MNTVVAGVDEVGRGPLAGPVVAAAVVLDPQQPIQGLKDSKALSIKRRNYYYDLIHQQALAVAIGRAEVEEIDSLNILQASLLAMQRAVQTLSLQPALCLIDGPHCPALNCESRGIIKGDTKEPAISAASIVAKVTRDREMLLWDQQYPQYGFAKHKGYPTSAHMQALKSHGPSAIHRRSFAPVRQCLQKLSDQ